MQTLQVTGIYEPTPPKHCRILTGQRFHELTVLALYGRTRAKKLLWLCQCSCGNMSVTTSSHLLNQHTKSCGHPVSFGESQTRTPEYVAFLAARHRCQQPKSQAYARYGGRGIEFRFTSYRDFIQEIGYKPDPSYELDRIDNNGHYESGNVRWVSRQVNAINRRSTTALTVNGITLSHTEWSRQTGVPVLSIAYRVKRGWCGTCAVHNQKNQVCDHKI